MIEVRISKLSAPCPAKIHTEGRTYDVQTEEFDSMEEALDWLDRVIAVSLDSGKAVYRDTEDGGHRQTGKVYSFWKDKVRQKGSYWTQHWVEFRKVNRERVLPEDWSDSGEVETAVTVR